MDDLTLITELVSNLGQFGMSAVFLWLFVREANAHDKTRAEYRRDLREIAGIHIDTLKRPEAEPEHEIPV